MTSTLPRLPVFEAIAKHDLSIPAVVHNPSGRTFTYGELAKDVADSTQRLKENAGGKALSGERIAFLVENGYDYIGMNVRDARRLTDSYSNTALNICKRCNCGPPLHDPSES
jgi:hypothetical protein